jgi:hypothetical protein
VRMLGLPLGHDALGELAGNRVSAERAGINVKQLHYFLLYWAGFDREDNCDIEANH